LSDVQRRTRTQLARGINISPLKKASKKKSIKRDRKRAKKKIKKSIINTNPGKRSNNIGKVKTKNIRNFLIKFKSQI